MIDSAVWKNFDATTKNEKWFRLLLDEIRNRKQWLCDPTRYRINQSYAEGTFDTAFVRKQYDTFNVPAADLNIQFEPIDLMGNRINAIVSMIEKLGFSPKAQTTDPTARDKRDSDIDLLKAEAELKPIREKMGKALGLNKPLPIANPEDFSSDVSPINKMGLDITNPIDEELFRDYLQRQVWEIALEIGMEHYLKQNEYNEKLKLLLADLVNDNCCAAQVVTNSYSGEAQLSYLYPFNVYQILAKQNDGKDAIAKGWEKDVSVREVIALMGKDITAEDLMQFLSLANTNGNTNYQGIWMYGSRTDLTDGFSYPSGVQKKDCCEWQQFLNITCLLGYSEVKSQNSDLFIHRIIDGNLNTVKESYDYNAPKNIHQVNSVTELKKDTDRFLEYKFYDVTYRGYYIPFTNLVFGFGKLPLAVRYGTKNELTDFSIVTQRLKGKSMTEKCIPFIKHIMSLWAKIQHFINESRASGESWDIDVVRELSLEIIGTDAKESKIMETLKTLQNQTNTVHKSVKTVEGQIVGGDADPVKQRIRGLDPTVVQMYDLIQRDKNQIIEITGVSDVLLATANTNAGLGVSQLALQQSINTIYYIQSAVQKLFGDVCLNFAQKIQYIIMGDKKSEAYKSVVMAIGQRNVDAIALMGTNPTFCFSIFIEWGLNEIQRGQVDQLTQLLVQSKSITSAQAFMIKDVKNWKLAGGLLFYFEQKTIQMSQKQQSIMAQQTMAAEQQKNQGKLAEINAEGQWKDKVANTQGEWDYKVELLKLQGKESMQDKKEISKHVGGDIKHQQDIQKTLLEDQLNKEDASSQQMHEKSLAAMNQPEPQEAA